MQTVGLASDGPSDLPVRAYLLMDAATGQVLHEHEGHTRLPMASTTKIMTAILALERGNPGDVVTVGRKPYDTGGSTIYLELGEQQTVEDLLYAMMLESANDAAVAVAEHLSGSEETFVELMNAKALEIGAVDTHFENSHGLHSPDHYSTAYDLALIARYAMRNQDFRHLVAVEEKVIPGYGVNPARRLYNRNRLLGYYEGANGTKNGFTEEAGLTIVASARRDDTELIAVLLGAENGLWTSSMALLDYGFEHFWSLVVAREGDVIGPAPMPGVPPIPAVAAGDLAVTLFRNERAPERRLVWDQHLSLPLEKGAILGTLQLVRGGDIIASVNLVTPSPVLPPGQGPPAGGGIGVDTAEGFSRWIYVGAVLGLLLMYIGVTRQRRRKGVYASGKPHGRGRLYEIRNRRRL